MEKKRKKKEIVGARENILPLSNISTIEVVVAASGPAFGRASAAYVEVQLLFPKINQQIWHLNHEKYWIRKGEANLENLFFVNTHLLASISWCRGVCLISVLSVNRNAFSQSFRAVIFIVNILCDFLQILKVGSVKELKKNN
jgi:hypothetical protein